MITVQSFTFNPFGENTFLLYDETLQCIIIDPGCSGTREENELKSFIEKNNLKPILLFNTHCHIDHILGNAFVHKTYGLHPVYHPEEEANLAMGESVAQMYGIPYHSSPKALHHLNEPQLLSFGNSSLKILFTPGHSAGSLSLYAEKENFLIGGDVLFNRSIGRTDLPGGDFKTLERSILSKLYTLPDHTKVYCGHGDPTTIGEEKIHNPFVKF
jgi:glyoxylase-like metal-dependent hydrolase (beta-lactamase superfamily II)